MTRPTLLFADDDDRSLRLLTAIFESEGYNVLTACDGQEAYEMALRTKVDLVISDILMPNVDGYYLCFKFRNNETLANVPIIIYSGTFTGQGEEKKAEQMGADLFIRKPASREVLLSSVAKLLSTEVTRDRTVTGSAEVTEIFHQYNSELIRKLEQRNSELEEAKANLENIVLQRTRSLDLANEELTASNEELRSANEELTSLNEQLEAASSEIKTQAATIIRQKEEALRLSEQNLEIVFSNTFESIIVLDAAGKAIFFNKAMADAVFRISGMVLEKGMYLWEVTTPERYAISKSLFMRAIKGEVIELEVPLPFETGMVVHRLRYSPVIVGSETRFVTVISTDISEKKAQEEKLREFEDYVRVIFDNTSDTFTLADKAFNIRAFNAASARNARMINNHELRMGDNIMETMSPTQREDFVRLLQRADEGETVNVESLHTIDGKETWFIHTIRSINDREGRFDGYCITGHEITEAKAAQLEVLRLNRSLLDFQNAIYRSSIVSIADKTGNITFVNDNFVSISGYNREELLGQNHRIVNSGHHPKSFWINMWKTISSGRIWREQVRNIRKDGSYYWVDTFVMPFLNEQGDVTAFLSIRNDITSRKRDEEELLQSRVLLEQAARVAKIGYWVLDTETRSLTVSKDMLHLLGTDEREYENDKMNLYRRIAAADRPKVPLLTELIDWPGGRMEIEYRIQRDDGSIRWINLKADFTQVLDNQKKVIGVVQDITERRIIEEVLRQYNERFDILAKATNDAIWDLDVRLDAIEWNHAVFNIFGYEHKNIKYDSRWWEGKIHPDDRHRVMSAYLDAIREQQNTWSATYRYACADGSYKHVFNRSYIIYEHHEPVRVIGAVQDISDRVMAVAEIEKLSLVASSTNNGVIITDPDGKIEWVNRSFERMTGYSIDEIKGQTSNFLYGDETDRLTVKRISDGLRKRETISEEIINYTKSGDKFWLKLDIAPVFDDTRKLKNFIAIQTDITELKEFENSITSIARELASLIEHANVPIFGVDTFGIINEWNRVAVELTGYDKMDAMGKKWSSVLPVSANAQMFTDALANVMIGIPASNIEVPITTKDGKTLILLLSASPRRMLNQRITGVLFVGQNITELTDYRNNLENKVEERTRELHNALEKEKELLKLKNQFVSIASHEFRTPLTSIALAAGFVKKYREKLSPKEIDEKLVNIEKQVNHMTYLLDDILMVGKAEAGKIPVNLKAIEIAGCIRNLCDEVSKTTGNTHRIELEEKLTYREIACDEKLLRNILINLMTNAIKFSPHASHINVFAGIENEDLILKVKDYGIGIPEKDIQNLFQPFFRAGNVESIQGTGLGLSIIKKAVDLLNGSVDLHSKQGEGTEIIVRLPV